MIERIGGFEELRVYRLAFDAAMRIYEVSRRWPAEERFGMTDQVRRSSRAVCANIAESWYQRRHVKHFASTLGRASSEGAETMVWLGFAGRCDYLANEEKESLSLAYDRIIGGLVKMSNAPEDWSTGRIREDPFVYDVPPEP